MKLKTFFTLSFVAVGLSVSSQDKKATPLKYQIGLSYSISASKNSTVNRKTASPITLPPNETYKTTSVLTSIYPASFTVGANLAVKLGVFTNIRLGVHYTECYINEQIERSFPGKENIEYSFETNQRRFNFIDMPIIWENYLKKSKNEKLNICFLMGVFPSLTLKSTNYNRENTNEIFKFNDENPDFYNHYDAKYKFTPVLLSVDLGLKLEYNVFKKVCLNLQTIYRNRGNVKFDERYTSFMLDLGVGYRF
jgi:hypothetical protein